MEKMTSMWKEKRLSDFENVEEIIIPNHTWIHFFVN